MSRSFFCLGKEARRRNSLRRATGLAGGGELLLFGLFPTLTRRTKVLSCRRGKEIPVDQVFCFERKVGKGGFSEVWLAKYRKKPKEDPVAIKLMPKKFINSTFVANEIAVLKTTHNCPFIVQLTASFRTQTHYAIVMKYATGGALYERVRMVRCFSELVARFYAAEIAEGLFGLHYRGIIHRDLNLNNVLIGDNGHVLLTDFGLSLLRDIDDEDELCEPWHDAGKSVFPAPEMLLGLAYDKTVDWWAFGIILYRMVCGQYPFQRKDRKPAEARDYCLDVIYKTEHYPERLSSPAVSLISRLLSRRRENRLGRGKFEENDVVNADFFSNVNWCQLREHAIPAPFSDMVQHPTSYRHKRVSLHLPTSYLPTSHAHDPQYRERSRSMERILRRSVGRASTFIG